MRQMLAIVGKDLLIEWRTRDLLSTMGVLGLATIVIFNFAVDFSRMPFRELGAPVLWIAFVFTGMTGLSRSFALERENQCLEGILLAPVDRGVLYLGKLIVNVLVLFVFEAFLLGLALLLLNQGKGAVHLEGERWLALLGVMFLNTLGFASVGTLFALMAQRTRRGDVLLPVMQAVMSLPVLIPAVVATQRVLHADVPLGDIEALVSLSGVFTIVVVAVSLIVFEYVVEE